MTDATDIIRQQREQIEQHHAEDRGWTVTPALVSAAHSHAAALTLAEAAHWVCVPEVWDMPDVLFTRRDELRQALAAYLATLDGGQS